MLSRPELRPAAPARARPLRTEVITDAAALQALQPAWDELAERAELEHPFLTHAWIAAWWDAFGAGREMRILAVYSGSACVAIAPLMSTRLRIAGIPLRALELIGNVHTPRSGFLADPRCAGAFPALRAAMERLADAWQVLVLPQLLAGAATQTQLEELGPRFRDRIGIWPGSPSPRLELAGSWDQFAQSLRHRQRKNLRNRRSRMAKMGALELEQVRGGALLRAALDDGLRIEAAGWKGTAATAIGSRRETARFYRGFAEHAERAGSLCLYFLNVGGKRVAFSYCLRFRKTLFVLKQGFDPSYGAGSPSQVLCALIIEEGFRRGDRWLDFLGDDEPWKREWTQAAQAHAWLYLFRPGLLPTLLHFLKFRLAPFLRRRWARAGKAGTRTEARDEADDDRA